MVLLAAFEPHRPVVDQEVDDLVLGFQLRHGPRHAGSVAEIQFDDLRLHACPLQNGRGDALQRLAIAAAQDRPAPRFGQADGQGCAQPSAGARNDDYRAFEVLQGNHGGKHMLATGDHAP